MPIRMTFYDHLCWVSARDQPEGSFIRDVEHAFLPSFSRKPIWTSCQTRQLMLVPMELISDNTDLRCHTMPASQGPWSIIGGWITRPLMLRGGDCLRFALHHIAPECIIVHLFRSFAFFSWVHLWLCSLFACHCEDLRYERWHFESGDASNPCLLRFFSSTDV